MWGFREELFGFAGFSGVVHHVETDVRAVVVYFGPEILL